MFQIRRSVFETNSSSSHSLTVGKEGVRDFSLIVEALQEGELVVSIEEFYGSDWERIVSPAGKIAYLVAQDHGRELEDYAFKGDVSEDLREDSVATDIMLRAVEEATGVHVSVQVNTTYPGIDHQSRGKAAEVMYNADVLLDFIFNKEAFIQMGSDQGIAPSKVTTDLGEVVDYFPDHFAEKLPRGPVVTLQAQKYRPDVSVELPNKGVSSSFSRENGCGLSEVAKHVQGFVATSAEITMLKPKDGYGYYWRSEDAINARAIDYLHDFIKTIRETHGGASLSKDIQVTVNVERSDKLDYQIPGPIIKLTGKMTSQNAGNLVEAMSSLEHDQKPSCK